jgi:GNAT superfamily N-acetyltransferase
MSQAEREQCRDVTYLWAGPDVRALLDVECGQRGSAREQRVTRSPARRLCTECTRGAVGDVSSGAIPLAGQDTLIACWRSLAKLSPGARLVRSTAALAAVFPAWTPLNNAIVHSAADGAVVAPIAARLKPVFADAGVDTWALWLPSRATDLDAPDQVHAINGLKRDTTTLVMRKVLSPGLRAHAGVVRTSIAAATRASAEEPIAVGDLPEPDGLPDLGAWVLVYDGFAVVGAWSYLHRTDCGIYALGTLPGWRRRGLARALVEHVLADARRRGARTATLQSTPTGQPLYESMAFEPVGRYEEWIST